MDEATFRKIKRRALKGLIQAALVAGILLGLSFIQITELARTAFLQSSGFSFLMIAGYTINRLFNDLGEKSSLARYYALGTAGGMLLGSAGLWLTLIPFNLFRLWPGRFALIILCGFIGLALSRLATYGEGRVGGIAGEFLHWLKDLPSLKFGFGALIGLYLVYFRPYLTYDSVSLMLVEWAIFCVLTGSILIRIWISLSHTHLNEQTGMEWRKHRLRIERISGPFHDYLTRVERQFITGGDPIGLYVLLIRQLDDNQIAESKITSSLEPLINFTGVNELRQNQRRVSNRTKSRRMSARLSILKTVYEQVEATVGLGRSRRPQDSAASGDFNLIKGDDASMKGLEQRFLTQKDKSGLFVRLALLLHRAGRRDEHIVWTLRSLTDDRGNPIEFELKKLRTQGFEPETDTITAK